jgi:hypothetical protein
VAAPALGGQHCGVRWGTIHAAGLPPPPPPPPPCWPLPGSTDGMRRTGRRPAGATATVAARATAEASQGGAGGTAGTAAAPRHAPCPRPSQKPSQTPALEGSNPRCVGRARGNVGGLRKGRWAPPGGPRGRRLRGPGPWGCPATAARTRSGCPRAGAAARGVGMGMIMGMVVIRGCRQVGVERRDTRCFNARGPSSGQICVMMAP